MSQVILDMGSGNTCKNNIDYACRMIDAVAAIDSHCHEVIFKWQLFQDEPPNVPLDHSVFRGAYEHALGLGYKTTASVFDKQSLDFLLTFDVPFVKIACRPRLYWLIGEVPRRVPVYVSIQPPNDGSTLDWFPLIDLCCVPKYPAMLADYPLSRPRYSDHTEGLMLWNIKPNIQIWEKHFILEDDPTNPDAAGHAIKPDLLKEVIG